MGAQIQQLFPLLVREDRLDFLVRRLANLRLLPGLFFGAQAAVSERPYLFGIVRENCIQVGFLIGCQVELVHDALNRDERTLRGAALDRNYAMRTSNVMIGVFICDS